MSDRLSHFANCDPFSNPEEWRNDGHSKRYRHGGPYGHSVGIGGGPAISLRDNEAGLASTVNGKQVILYQIHNVDNTLAYGQRVVPVTGPYEGKELQVTSLEPHKLGPQEAPTGGESNNCSAQVVQCVPVAS